MESDLPTDRFTWHPSANYHKNSANNNFHFNNSLPFDDSGISLKELQMSSDDHQQYYSDRPSPIVRASPNSAVGELPDLTINDDDSRAAEYAGNLPETSSEANILSPRDELSVIANKTPKTHFIAIAVLFTVNLLNYMDRFTISGVLTYVQSYYSINDSEAGLLQTVFICAYMIFAPVCGYLGDRYSRKWIMAAGIFVWSMAVLASSFVPSNHYWAFLFCRAVVGVGEASYSTVSPTLIADMFAKEMRSKMLMVFYFAIPVGSGLGFVVGANVASLAGGIWQWGVRVTPILGVVCLLLIILVLKEPERGASEDKGQSENIHPSSFFEDLRALANNKSYIWSTFGFTAVAFVAGSLSWWTPNYVIYSVYVNHNVPDKARINLIFGLITCLSGFLGVLIGSNWARYWRRTNPRADPLVCGTGLLLCTPFLFLALNITHWNLTLAWPLVFCAVTSLSLNWAIVSDMLLYIVIPPRRATASAFQILISHLLGDAFSPYLIGLVSDSLRGSDESYFMHFYSLKYAMYIPSFVLVFGGFFFLGTAWFIEEDKKKCELAIKGLNAQIDGVAVTNSSGNSAINASESTAKLIRNDDLDTDSVYRPTVEGENNSSLANGIARL